MISTDRTYKDFSKTSTAYDVMVTFQLNTEMEINELELITADFKPSTFIVTDEITQIGEFDVGGTICNTFEAELMTGISSIDEIIYTGVKLEFGVPDGTGFPSHSFQKGVYTVEPFIRNGFITKIKGYDHMGDPEYNTANINGMDFTHMSFKTAIQALGFPLADDFSWYNTTVPPIKISKEYGTENATKRDVLGWLCQLLGMYARFNSDGLLELRRFHTDYLDESLDGGRFAPWGFADDADGGSFNPWNTGYEADEGTFVGSYVVTKLISRPEVEYNEITVTGVYAEGRDGTSYAMGDDGYYLIVKENPFLASGADIAQFPIGMNMDTLLFTPFSLECMGDPSMEAGDIVEFDDSGYAKRSIATKIQFNLGGSTVISCEGSAERRSTLEELQADSSSEPYVPYLIEDQYPDGVDNWVAPAYLTGSGKVILMTITTGKSIANITNIAFVPETGGGMRFRGATDYVGGSNYIDPNNYTLDITKNGDYQLRVRIEFTSAIISGVTNMALSAEILGNFVFS